MTKTKIAAALTALTLATTLAIPSTQAQAGSFGTGLAVGLVGGALIGGAVASGAYAGPAYHGYGPGYRRCRWVRQYDAYGFYVGTSKVCHYY
jgi:hypothetical protein